MLCVFFPHQECQRNSDRATYDPSELPYRFDRTETTCFFLVSDSASRLPAYHCVVAHEKDCSLITRGRLSWSHIRRQRAVLWKVHTIRRHGSLKARQLVRDQDIR